MAITAHPGAAPTQTPDQRLAVAVMVRICCPLCDHSLPLEQLAAEARCRWCDGIVALTAAAWKALLGGLDETDEDGELWLDDWRANHRVRTVEPGCPSCRRPVDDRARGELTCACGSQLVIRDADTLVREAAPRARVVIERRQTEVSVPAVRFMTPCGHRAATDGSRREIACPWCEARVQVPDALWSELRPPAAATGFMLVLEQG